MPALQAIFIPDSSDGDTVTVDGKTWFKPVLFEGLTWLQINAVCPSSNNGICVNGGVLSGQDMSGLTWASVDDINALFNYFMGSILMGPGPDQYEELNSPWAPSFIAAFGKTDTDFPTGYSDRTYGWSRTVVDAGFPKHVGIYDCLSVAACPDGSEFDKARTLGDFCEDCNGSGAWFYRPEP